MDEQTNAAAISQYYDKLQGIAHGDYLIAIRNLHQVFVQRQKIAEMLLTTQSNEGEKCLYMLDQVIRRTLFLEESS